MQPIYVAKLFELLKFLEIEQRAVGKALGVSKTPISLWAHGKRPVPKAQAVPFLRYVDRAIREAIERERVRQYPQEVPEADMWAQMRSMSLEEAKTHHTAWVTEKVGREAALPLCRELNSRLYLWELELAASRGILAQEIHGGIRRLLPYAQQDPMKWSQAERRALHEKVLELAKHIRYLEQLLDRPEEREWSRPAGYAGDRHPVAYFHDLARFVGIELVDVS